MIREFENQSIGILCGGNSTEKEVSIRSGENVLKALLKLGYKAQLVILDESDYFDSNQHSIYFNAIHGGIGENGVLSSYLNQLKKKFTGCSSFAATLAWNKIYFKRFLHRLNIKCPKTFAATSDPSSLNYPIMVKPIQGGSSIFLNKINNATELSKFQQQNSDTLYLFFIEEYIQGTEATIGMLHTGKHLEVLPILEIYPHAEFYDYYTKYTPGKTDFKFNHNLSQDVQKVCKDISRLIQSNLSFLGASRIDVIIDKDNIPHVLEINTSPGLTNTSDIPAQAQEAGISQNLLMETILKSALWPK